MTNKGKSVKKRKRKRKCIFTWNFFVQRSLKEISTRRLWKDSSAWSVSHDESQPSDEFPSSKFSEARVANKRRNNRLPFYFSGDGFSCFSFTVAVHDDDDGDVQEIHAGQLAIGVKRKREEKQRSCRQLSPNGKEALRGSFCHLVVWFYGSSPSSCDANSIQREQPIRRLAIEPQAIFLRPFQLLLYLLFRLTPGNRAIIISAHQDRKIIVQLYFFFTSLLPSFYF